MEMELMTNHAYGMKPNSNMMGFRELLTGEHIYISGGGTPELRTLPDLTLCVSSSDCSSVSLLISFII